MDNKNKEKSCGAVVFTREDGTIRYVIVQQRSGMHCFPKGHVENNETEEQTALREIWEETGLRPTIIPGFRETETYEVRKKPGTLKDVIYFLAEYADQSIELPVTDEIHEISLCSYEEALNLLEMESRKTILTKANEFLTKDSTLTSDNQEKLFIRTATIEDLDAVTAVEAVCFPPAEAAPREAFAERLISYGNHFWLLFDGEKLVSFVDGFVTDEEDLTDEMFADASLHNESGAWQMIFGVATIPDEQKKGYAGQLLNRAIRDAKAQGRKGLVLTCKDRLVHYYAKFGFINEGRTDKSNHGGAEWNQMRLTF